MGLDVFLHPAGVRRRKSSRRLGTIALGIKVVAHELVKARVAGLEILIDLAVPQHLKNNGHLVQVHNFLVKALLGVQRRETRHEHL